MLSQSQIKKIIMFHVRKYADNESLNPSRKSTFTPRLADEMEVHRNGYKIDWNNSVVRKNDSVVYMIEKKYNNKGNMIVKLAEI